MSAVRNERQNAGRGEVQGSQPWRFQAYNYSNVNIAAWRDAAQGEWGARTNEAYNFGNVNVAFGAQQGVGKYVVNSMSTK